MFSLKREFYLLTNIIHIIIKQIKLLIFHTACYIENIWLAYCKIDFTFLTTTPTMVNTHRNVPKVGIEISVEFNKQYYFLGHAK